MKTYKQERELHHLLIESNNMPHFGKDKYIFCKIALGSICTQKSVGY
jgi:hypothetical protein